MSFHGYIKLVNVFYLDLVMHHFKVNNDGINRAEIYQPLNDELLKAA